MTYLKSKLMLFLTVLLVLQFNSCVLPTDTDEDLDEDGNLIILDDYEENNSRIEAYNVNLGSIYSARISEKSDDDWFKFKTSHESNTYDKIKITITGVESSLAIRMELYDISGASLTSVEPKNYGQDVTYTFATSGAEFYLRFSGWDAYINDHKSTGSYSFTIENLELNDDFVPNHVIDSSYLISLDTAYSAVLVSKYETDCYKFVNPAQGVWNSYTITISNVESSLCPGLEVYDSSKDEFRDYYYESSHSYGADLTYTFISKDDLFYMKITGWDGYINNYKSSGKYDITVLNNANDTNEPDDTFETAREITVFPSSEILGTIIKTAANNNGGDYEFFKVTLNGNKKVLWSIDPEESNTELHFDVYDASKESLGNVDGDDGQTITGSLNNTSSTSTTFYIRLGAFVGTNGNYTINFTETNSN